MQLRTLPLFAFLAGLISLSLFSFKGSQEKKVLADSLRALYSRPPEQWPAPFLDKGAVFAELGVLPVSPINKDSLKEEIQLGRVLFHDPRLSGSNQISCSSCHAVDLNWTDGRRVAVGNDHKTTSRNTPSIQNSWFQKALFWDGRANSLEEQAPISIANPHEMNQNPVELPSKLSKIEGYEPLFSAAFGDGEITLDRITRAIATFERTISSRKTDFDYFVEGQYNRLNDKEIEGLHLFRTKARCINCHNGPLFTDEQFHNAGLTYYQRKYEDLGRYYFTQEPEDVGKFKTPGLRDVMRTNPWFHNGIFDNIEGVINMYNAGMPRTKAKADQINDPLFPNTSPLLRPLNLSDGEKEALIAFLEAITTQPLREPRPELPSL